MNIWGNHSATQYPDFFNATLDGSAAVQVINDDAWLQGEFIETVQKRGAAVIKARGASSAASAANAALDGIKSIITPTEAGDSFSAAVCSDGSYGVEEGLISSFPLTSDGAKWEQRFAQGKPVTRLKRAGTARGTGTTVYFRPDATIFPKTTFDANLIAERLETASYLHKGVKIVFANESVSERQVFQHDEGLPDYLRRILTDRNTPAAHDLAFSVTRDHPISNLRLDLVLQWTESTDEHLRSYVNGIPTGSGGTHENGFRARLVAHALHHNPCRA